MPFNIIMMMLRTYRVFRLVAALAVTLGITLPVIQVVCAMDGHAMEAMSSHENHADHESPPVDLDCERPPDC